MMVRYKTYAYFTTKHIKQIIYNFCIYFRIILQVRLWNIAEKKSLSAIQAHEGYVRGICVDPDPDFAEQFLTVGDDKCIKQWNCGSSNFASKNVDEPIQSIPTKVSKFTQVCSKIETCNKFIIDSREFCTIFHTVISSEFSLPVAKALTFMITIEPRQ